jgi:transcriptional regulator with XRE-family HTH domain
MEIAFCLAQLNFKFIFIKNFEDNLVKKQMEINMNIGQKIKEMRNQKGLTQEELADRAELSKGFISQLERDLTSPSIATLVDILQCLGTNLEEFFSNTTLEQVVFKKTDYFEKYDTDLKNLVKWIIPNAQKNIMEPIHLTLDPGGSTYPDNPHEGEEFGYVISGSISLHIGNRSIKAKKGESFYFTANKQHYITASYKTGATLLWVSTPPSF